MYHSFLKIDADEKDELQKEAEEMNELGIRKLPRDDDGSDPDKVRFTLYHPGIQPFKGDCSLFS